MQCHIHLSVISLGFVCLFVFLGAPGKILNKFNSYRHVGMFETPYLNNYLFHSFVVIIQKKIFFFIKEDSKGLPKLGEGRYSIYMIMINNSLMEID